MPFIRAGAGIPFITKDADARLDYPVAWNEFLPAGDTIDTVAWDVATGLTLDAQEINASEVTDDDGNVYPAGTLAIPWLMGGTVGERYRVRCRITSDQGRIADQSFDVVVVSK